MDVVIQSTQTIPILSFFSGGGFLDIGFEQNGFDVIWSNEINPHFVILRNYAYNKWLQTVSPDKESLINTTESIENLTSLSIKRQAWNRQPAIWGIVGGPPCQDFSSSGPNHGFRGKRGRLTKVFFQAIEEMMPSFFVVENVHNLYFKHRAGLFRSLKPLCANYHIDFKILNSIEFGVPQDRQRLFIIGFRKTTFKRHPFEQVHGPFKFSWPENKNYKDAIAKYDWPETNKFGLDIAKPVAIPNELTVSCCLVSPSSGIPNSNEFFASYSEKFWKVREGDTKNRSFKRLHRFRYSPTACYGNNEVHLHPYEARRISVREALNIQSVPLAYELPEVLGQHVGLSSKFKMIGNAVPASLAGAVAKSIYSFITKAIHNNGYMDEEKTERGDVKNPVKEHQAGKAHSFAFA